MNSGNNLYPQVILHDSYVNKIYYDKRKIVFEFEPYGYYVKSKDKYYGCNKSKIIFDLKEDESYEIQLKKDICLFGFVFTMVEDISIEKLKRKLDAGKIDIEFIYEYYALDSCFYEIMVHEKNVNKWGYLKLEIANIEYEWDKIDCNYPL